MTQDRGRIVLAAQHGPGERQQILCLLGTAGSLPGPQRGQVHDAADRHRHGHEEQQREQALAVRDRESVHGRREVPVHQQARRHRGQDRGPESADNRDRDDGHQVDEKIVAKVEAQAMRRQGQRQERQAAHGQQDADQDAARADAAGQVGYPALATGGSLLAAGVARRNIHDKQCERCGEMPHYHSGRGGCGRADGDGDGRPGRVRAGHLKLAVRRPGKSGHGKPPDDRQHRGDDGLSDGTSGRDDDHSQDRHPASRQAAVARRRGCADYQECAESGRERKRRGQTAPSPVPQARRSGPARPRPARSRPV